MGEVLEDGTVVLNKPNEIVFARLATLKAGLLLETKGMIRCGQSCYAILKGMGYKGNREKVLAQVRADVEAQLKQ